MKTSLSSSALIIAAVSTVAAFAGVVVCFGVSLTVLVGCFVAAFTGAMIVSDYSRRERTLTLAPVVVPPAGSFARETPRADSRLAA